MMMLCDFRCNSMSAVVLCTQVYGSTECHFSSFSLYLLVMKGAIFSKYAACNNNAISLLCAF